MIGTHVPALPEARALPQTQEERIEAARRLVSTLHEAYATAPTVATSLSKQGEAVWLYPEIGAMTQRGDVTAHYITALSQWRESAARANPLANYSLGDVLQNTRTQSIFWAEIASQYDPEARNVLLHFFAGLEDKFVDRVASMAFVWAKQNGLDTNEKKDELFINMANWAQREAAQQEAEESPWEILSTPVRWVGSTLAKSANWLVGVFSGQDEKDRRAGLTLGQQVMWDNFGIEMDSFWGKTTSGLLDAAVMLGLDPLVGATKFIGGVRLANRIANPALIAGQSRFRQTVQAAVPFLGRNLSGLHQVTGRSPLRRVGYSLASKTPDELFQRMVKIGVMEDIVNLSKADDLAGLYRKYPFTKTLHDRQIEALSKMNPQEAGDFFSAIHLVDRLTDTEGAARAAQGVQRLREQYSAKAVEAVMDGRATLGDLLTDAAYNVGNKIDASAGMWAYDNATGLWRQVPAAAQNSGEVRAVFAGTYKSSTLNGFVRWMEVTRKAPKTAAAIQKSIINGKRLSAKDMTYLQDYAKAKGVQVLQGGGSRKGFFRIVLDDSILVQGIDAAPTGNIIDPALAKRIIIEDATLKALQRKPDKAFVVTNFPRRVASETIRNMKMWDTNSWMNSVGRRLIHGFRASAPDTINLMKRWEGSNDLRRVLNHFGVRPSRVDELVNEFVRLDAADRMDFVANQVVREIGTATKTPFMEYGLLEIFNRMGVRQYSTSGVSRVVDTLGAHNLPIVPSQLVDKMPLPINQMHEIMRRSGSAAQPFRWIPKMLRSGKTEAKRIEIYDRLKAKLGPQAETMTTAELQRLAYSFVGPGGENRGRIANAFNWAGGAFNKVFFTPFKKSMLVFRPIQWLWRVAILEEPMRAAAMGLPSYFTNPFSWASDVKLARASQKAEKWREVVNTWVEAEVSRVMGSTRSVDEALAQVRYSLGRYNETGDLGRAAQESFEAFMGRNKDGFNSVSDVRRAFEEFLSGAIDRPTTKSALDNVPAIIRRQARKIEKVETRLSAQGLPKMYDVVEDLPEIQNKTLHHLLGDELVSSGPVPLVWGENQATIGRKAVGEALGGRMNMLLDDQMGLFAVRRVAHHVSGTEMAADLTAEALTHKSQWNTMKPIIKRFFPDEVDDVVLAQKYLDEILEPEVHAIFGGLWRTLDPEDASRVVEAIASRKAVKIVGSSGTTYDLNFSRAARSSLKRKMGQFSINETEDWMLRDMPTQVMGPTNDPRFSINGEIKPLRAMANWVLNTFGEEATQIMSRRPAFLFKQREQFKYYKALGMRDDLARTLSIKDATYIANHTFYNLQEMPYFVKKMNKVVPFFGATWEVAQTWFGKIPMFMGGGGVLGWTMGVPAMVRSFDRLINAGVALGLVRIDVTDTGKREYTLVLPDPSDANWADPGEAIGAVGAALLNTPATILSHIIGIRNELDLPKGGYEIAIGHPMDPFNYGALSYINFAIGLAPAAALPLTQIARIAGVSDHQRTSAREGESIVDIANRLEVDVEDLLRMNRQAIVDAHGWDNYEGLVRGTLDPTAFGLATDTLLIAPNTGIGSWVYDNLLMPFGEVRDLNSMVESMVPSAFRNILFSLGIHGWVEDGFWTDGEFSGIGGAFSNTSKVSLANAITEGIMHLEATEGAFTAILEQAKIVQELRNGTDQEAYSKAVLQLEVMEEQLLERATEQAAGTIFVRNMLGFFLPATPRFMREHQEALNAYWSSRDYAEDLRFNAGEALPIPEGGFKGIEDLDQFLSLLNEWLSDPSGQGARSVVRQNLPEIFPYLQSKTYWAEGGLPPEISGIEEYMESIARGDRKNIPLGVIMYRMANAGIDADYWAQYTLEFGTNPTQAAANALWDYAKYQEMQEERYSSKDALLLQDDMRGGAYLKWREKNSDQYSLLEAQLEEYRNLQSSLRFLENSQPDPMMPAADQQALSEHLQGVNRHIRDTINLLREQMEEEPWTRNPFHEALMKYWDGPNADYYEEMNSYWTAISQSDDRLERSLLHMLRKEAKDRWWMVRPEIDGVAFPTPVDLSWQRKDEQERFEYVQRQALLPLEFLDLEATNRIAEITEMGSRLFPTEPEQMNVYHSYSRALEQLNQMYRANEITSTQRTRAREKLDERVTQYLIDNGRSQEAMYRKLWPIEKLYILGVLPPELEQFVPVVRYIREALQAADVGPTSNLGRQLTFPLYERIYAMREADPHLGNVLREMGLKLFDTDALSSILPRLFFDDEWGW